MTEQICLHRSPVAYTAIKIANKRLRHPERHPVKKKKYIPSTKYAKNDAFNIEKRQRQPKGNCLPRWHYGGRGVAYRVTARRLRESAHFWVRFEQPSVVSLSLLFLPVLRPAVHKELFIPFVLFPPGNLPVEVGGVGREWLEGHTDLFALDVHVEWKPCGCIRSAGVWWEKKREGGLRVLEVRDEAYFLLDCCCGCSCWSYRLWGSNAKMI